MDDNVKTDIKHDCPKCHAKFSICKTWEHDKWVYFCMTKGCDYRKEVEVTKEEADDFNGGS